MEYFTNPEIPENLDGVRDGHGRSFLLVLLKALGFLVAFLAIIDILTRLLAPFVPFNWEKALIPDSLLRPASAGSAVVIEKELNLLAGRLSSVMNLPTDMGITVHYVDDPTVNAMATFGGQVIIFRGLLERLESEDALAAVLAHEIGHVKNRDMIKGLIKAVSLTLLSGAVGSSGHSTGLEQTVGQIGLMSYSRGQEAKADREATLALGRLYGHAKGFDECFQVFLSVPEAELSRLTPEILSSHPDTLKRIKRSQELAAELGLPAEGRLAPLPGALRLKKNTAASPAPSGSIPAL